ncbi:hypothetical protein DICVIV_10428 [Dictyocaulus viviparus]|uniref:Telomere length regulation protein conserved domain-containing protein n=1 Tax=Dictyocaulus viviparus TaxID=29172 RepID=A0A0D8XII5_DICVI|nr:hypothetical protein DICVIV_10428 [Dictyocaulus viviparus]
MFVGEAISSWMGHEEQLKFEYEENDWLLEMRRIYDGIPLVVDGTQKNEDLPCNDNVQCDMQLSTSSECVLESHTLDSDDDEDFIAYDVPDGEKNFDKLVDGSEPDKKLHAPNYIRDCMKQLDEKEKYEVFEAAFFALNSMIRRKAIGFVDIADVLAKKLVFLEDKFSTKDFENIRLQCLVSCLVMRPEIAPKIADVVFCRNCTFFHSCLDI